MTVRRLGLALAALGLGLAGCTRPQTCAARGTTTDLSGVASYAIGASAGHTMSLDVTVYDYIESCTYGGEKFPIQVGNCTLWASLQQGPEPPSRFFPGNPSAWAGIDSGQACDLPLLGGTARARRRNKPHFARTARREEAARVPRFGAEIAPEGPARGRRTPSNPAFSCARRIAASVGRANPRRAPIVYATDSSS